MKRKSVPPASKFNDGFEFAKHIYNPKTELNLNETLIQWKMNSISPTQNVERLIEAREAHKVELFKEAFKYDEQTEQRALKWEKAYYEREIADFTESIKELKMDSPGIVSYQGYIDYCKLKLEGYQPKAPESTIQPKAPESTIQPKAPEETLDTLVHIGIVDTLFKKYGSQFPGETLESWQRRFSKGKKVLKAINMEPKVTKATMDNNRHLMFTIIKRIDEFLYDNKELPTGFNGLVQNNFGFDYKSAKNRIKNEHSESESINSILIIGRQFDNS